MRQNTVYEITEKQEIELIKKYHKYCKNQNQCDDCEIEDICNRFDSAITSLDDYFDMWGED